MRVGIDISQLAYPGTGVATYTEGLIEALLKIDGSNNYVFFYSSLRRQIQNSKFKSQNLNSKLKIYKFPPLLLETLWNRIHVLPIEKLIGSVDVFHTSDWLEPPSKCPRITTIHDLVVYKYPETLHPRIVSNQRRKLEWVKRESKLIIAVSQSTKQDIIEILKISEERIRVVYEACSPSFYPAGQAIDSIEKIKRKYEIGGGYILVVGTREPRKNLERVIEAYSFLASQHPDLSLVIVGKYGWGEDLNKFKVPASPASGQGGQSSRFKVLGYVPKEDLSALYAGAECFVYPSLYEGFGLPILEAMACGCPVVTSNVSSLPEIAGSAAVLVNPENIGEIAAGVEKAIKNKVSLIKKGYQRVNEFSWEKTAKETLEVYRGVVL